MTEPAHVPDKDAKDILREWEEADEPEVFEWHEYPVFGHDE